MAEAGILWRFMALGRACGAAVLLITVLPTSGCQEDLEGNIRRYATRVAPITTEQGVAGILVTPSIVAQDAVLVRDPSSGTLFAALVDDEFAESEDGRDLVEEIEWSEPPVFLVTDLKGGRDLGGALIDVAAPESWEVEIYGRDAAARSLYAGTEGDEIAALATFPADELEAYEKSRSNEAPRSERSSRRCCCRCGGQDCGCVACSGPTCFCNCVSCTASCDVVISG